MSVIGKVLILYTEMTSIQIRLYSFPLDILETPKLTLYSIYTHFNVSTTDNFWKHCGKRRNCSFSHNVFYSIRFIIEFPFVRIFDITFLFAAKLEKPKIGIRGKGLKANASFQWNVKIYWKLGRKCWLPVFSMFSRGFLVQVKKCKDCVANGYTSPKMTDPHLVLPGR